MRVVGETYFTTRSAYVGLCSHSDGARDCSEKMCHDGIFQIDDSEHSRSQKLIRKTS